MISKDLLVKYTTNAILLVTVFIDAIEQAVRIAATCVGIVLTFFLIYQVIVNLRVKRIEAKKLKAEQKMAEERLKKYNIKPKP
jgi:uncharacterized membrane protein